MSLYSEVVLCMECQSLEGRAELGLETLNLYRERRIRTNVPLADYKSEGKTLLGGRARLPPSEDQK